MNNKCKTQQFKLHTHTVANDNLSNQMKVISDWLWQVASQPAVPIATVATATSYYKGHSI